MFSGVSARCSSQPAEDYNTTVSRMPTAAHTARGHMVVALRSPSYRSSRRSVTSTEKPCVMACLVLAPASSASRSRRVRPSTPTPRPTMDASATVQLLTDICQNQRLASPRISFCRAADRHVLSLCSHNLLAFASSYICRRAMISAFSAARARFPHVLVRRLLAHYRQEDRAGMRQGSAWTSRWIRPPPMPSSAPPSRRSAFLSAHLGQSADEFAFGRHVNSRRVWVISVSVKPPSVNRATNANIHALVFQGDRVAHRRARRRRFLLKFLPRRG